MGQDVIGPRGLKQIDPARAEGYARTTLKGGDVLLCVRGTTGLVSEASADLKGANVTRGIVPIRFDAEKIDVRFAFCQLTSPAVQDQIANATYGAALMQINIRDVRQLRFAVPNRDVQVEVADRIEAIFAHRADLESQYHSKLRDLDDLQQSLLQRAFSGELTDDGSSADSLDREISEALNAAINEVDGSPVSSGEVEKARRRDPKGARTVDQLNELFGKKIAD